MSKSPSIPEKHFSEDNRANGNPPEQSVDSTSSVDSSAQINKNPRQELSQIITNKIESSNDLLEIEKLVNIAVNLESDHLYIQKYKAEIVLKKALSTNDPSVREQLLDFYGILFSKQQERIQNYFLKIMTGLFLVIGTAIGIYGVLLEIPIVLGVAGVLLGGSMFSIVPEHISKMIDQLNIPDVFPKITSSNLDNTLTTGDKDKNDDN